MDVWIDKPKCTGCHHCFDVCPVAVFEMRSRKDLAAANADNAPEAMKWTGKSEQQVIDKWGSVQDGHKHFADESDGTSGGISVGVNGSSCILCQACLIECEGECIHITDDTGTTYQSVYK